MARKVRKRRLDAPDKVGDRLDREGRGEARLPGSSTPKPRKRIIKLAGARTFFRATTFTHGLNNPFA
jgi:hypothetical protein